MAEANPGVPFSLGVDICQVVRSHFGACVKGSRPVAGGRAGGSSPPEIFRLELNSATKVEFFY